MAMRKYRPVTGGRPRPDPEFADQVRAVVDEHWSTSTVVQHDDYVEAHLKESSWGEITARENVVDELEALGFAVDPHASPYKLNAWLPEADGAPGDDAAG